MPKIKKYFQDYSDRHKRRLIQEQNSRDMQTVFDEYISDRHINIPSRIYCDVTQNTCATINSRNYEKNINVDEMACLHLVNNRFIDHSMYLHEVNDSNVGRMIGNNNNDDIEIDNNSNTCSLPDYRYSDSELELSENDDDDIDEIDNNFELQFENSATEYNVLSSITDENSELKQKNFKTDITEWAQKFKIKLNATTALLSILRQFTDVEFPKDARTLLRTPRSTVIFPMNNGNYVHFDLSKIVQNIIEIRLAMQSDFDAINLLVNTDGAPVGNSTIKNLWPILCKDLSLKRVYAIGVFHGIGKPKNRDEFLRRFVEDATQLINNGFFYNNKKYNVRLAGFVCDAPAKAYILNVKTHTGYSSCTKCKIEGERIDGATCFPGQVDRLRTDEEFRNLDYNFDYQHGETILNRLPNVGLVSRVALDSMHLVYLGVTRFLIKLWIEGPLMCRLSMHQIETISDRLLELNKFLPSDFARRPRRLEEWKYWKATEYRQFLLYSGPLVLRDVLRSDLYVHFLTLHVAITMLTYTTSKKHPIFVHDSDRLKYTNDLLIHFVKLFEALYGPRYVSFNVHNLLHLSSEVDKFGSLEMFSAFPFENFIASLKLLIRKGDRPLQQIARRLAEFDSVNERKRDEVIKAKNSYVNLRKLHRNGPVDDYRNYEYQYKILETNNYSINSEDRKNSCVVLENGTIIDIYNFATSKNKLYLIGRQLTAINKNLYEKPCLSGHNGIRIVDCDTTTIVRSWLYTKIHCKMYKMLDQENLVLFPIIHTIDNY